MPFPNENKTLIGKDGVDITKANSLLQETYEILAWNFYDKAVYDENAVWVLPSGIGIYTGTIYVKINDRIYNLVDMLVKKDGFMRQITNIYSFIGSDSYPDLIILPARIVFPSEVKTFAGKDGASISETAAQTEDTYATRGWDFVNTWVMSETHPELFSLKNNHIF